MATKNSKNSIGKPEIPSIPSGTQRTKEYREKSTLLDRSRWELYIDNSIRAQILKIAHVEGLKAGETAEALLALGIDAYASGSKTRNPDSVSIDSSLPRSEVVEASISTPRRHRFKLHRSELVPTQEQTPESQVNIASSVTAEEAQQAAKDRYRFEHIVYAIRGRSNPLGMDRERHRIGFEDETSPSSGAKSLTKPADT